MMKKKNELEIKKEKKEDIKRVNKKSCPRCAKRNSLENKVCDACGFRFDKKKSGVLKNLFLSFCLVAILFLFLYFHQENIVKNITLVLKIGALFFLLFVIVSIFTYGEKEKIHYSAEEKIVSKNLHFFKAFSRIILILGFLIGAIFLLYFVMKEIV